MDRIDTKDRIKQLRHIIKNIILKYAAIAPSYGDIEVDTVFDEVGEHYQLWHIGWERKKRIHGCVLHIKIKDEKLWIQHDGIAHGITEELLEAGVLPQEIVLGFFFPSERKHLPFAIA
jgi:hypothetical protein